MDDPFAIFSVEFSLKRFPVVVKIPNKNDNHAESLSLTVYVFYTAWIIIY